ncbi:Proline--tRNA ligase [uncultured archaeon]|nr:Proline--tRNA ligase [uncultured archaeon]
MQPEELKKYAEEHGIEAEFIEHPAADGLTSNGAALATGVSLSNIVKVLCFTGKHGKCFVILQGDKKVNLKKIQGFEKARMASAQELKEWFGFEPGCVPPICLPDKVPKFIDAPIKGLPFLVGSAGSRFAGIKLKPSYVISQKNVTVADISI